MLQNEREGASRTQSFSFFNFAKFAVTANKHSKSKFNAVQAKENIDLEKSVWIEKSKITILQKDLMPFCTATEICSRWKNSWANDFEDHAPVQSM